MTEAFAREVGQIVSRELRRGVLMGYAPPPYPAPKLNVDRFGLPRDYATYMWLVYHQRVDDRSPERVAFLEGPKRGGLPNFGQQMCMG